jgi:hypothetical protein
MTLTAEPPAWNSCCARCNGLDVTFMVPAWARPPPPATPHTTVRTMSRLAPGPASPDVASVSTAFRRAEAAWNCRDALAGGVCHVPSRAALSSPISTAVAALHSSDQQPLESHQIDPRSPHAGVDLVAATEDARSRCRSEPTPLRIRTRGRTGRAASGWSPPGREAVRPFTLLREVYGRWLCTSVSTKGRA